MAQNVENIDFEHFSLQLYNDGLYCDFWVPWNISDEIHTLSVVAIVVEIKLPAG